MRQHLAREGMIAQKEMVLLLLISESGKRSKRGWTVIGILGLKKVLSLVMRSIIPLLNTRT
jgi:hypothetical protein